MPTIIDYPSVLQRMTAAGFKCNYYNSGAFGFAGDAAVLYRGWIGPPDSTIKPQFIPLLRTVAAPHAATLAAAAVKLWQQIPAPAVWVMPKSHWHFELHDGSREWLPGVLNEIGVDPANLENRADGSAVEFTAGEAASFQRLVTALLEGLKVSDFSLAFPGCPIVATLHQHTQIWWSTTDPALIGVLDQIIPAPGQ
jgi:hypothetical protein